MSKAWNTCILHLWDGHKPKRPMNVEVGVRNAPPCHHVLEYFVPSWWTACGDCATFRVWSLTRRSVTGYGLWGLITLLDFLFSLCLWCVDEVWLSVISCFRINRPASHSYCHVFPALMDGVCSEVVTQNKLSSSKLLWVVFRNIKLNYTLVIKVNLITLPHLSSLVAVVELGPAHHHYGSRFGLSWHWVVPTWERMPRWGEDMWGWENWSAPNANP